MDKIVIKINKFNSPANNRLTQYSEIPQRIDRALSEIIPDMNSGGEAVIIIEVLPL